LWTRISAEGSGLSEIGRDGEGSKEGKGGVWDLRNSILVLGI